MVNACLVHGTCMRMHCTGPNIEQVHGVGVFSLIERAAGESDRERKERLILCLPARQKRNKMATDGALTSAGAGTPTSTPVSTPVTTPLNTASSVPQSTLTNILSVLVNQAMREAIANPSHGGQGQWGSIAKRDGVV